MTSKGRSGRRRRCANCNARLRGRFCVRCGQRDLEYDRVVCDNCGAEKLGHYCAVCGQSDRNYRRSVFPVVGEVLSETFEIDSRLLNTVPKLLVRPGFLSLEFSRNRRASYLSPFRLYLFTSIIFFFVLSLSLDLPEGPGPGRGAVRNGEGLAPITFGETGEERPWLRISINDDDEDDDEDGEDEQDVKADEDDEKSAAPPGPTGTRNTKDTAATPAEVAVTAVTGGDEAGPEARPPPRVPSPSLTEQQQEAFERLAPALDEERRRRLVEVFRRSALAEAVVQGARSISDEDVANATATQRYVVGQLIDILHRPFDAVRTWFENLPVAMFCLLPLFALLLKACYSNRGLFYTEHLVFAMHNHTVAFLAFTVIVPLPEGSAAAGMLAQLLLLALAAYYFVAMRRFYGGSRFGTTIRFLLLLNLYGLLLLVALAGAAAAVFLLF